MQDDIFSGLDTGSRQTWLSLVEKDLKGASFDEKLITRVDDLHIMPLYTAENIPVRVDESDADVDTDSEVSEEGFLLEESAQPITWNICEEITLHTGDYLNDMLLPVLRRGCNFIYLKTDHWDKFFDEIRKIEYPATFVLEVQGDLTEEDIVNIWRDRVGFIGERDRLIHSIEFDPVSYWMQVGNVENANKTFNNLADMFFRLTAHLQDCRLIKIDASKVEQNSVTGQLAYALAVASEYFTQLGKRNVPIEELIYLVTFRFHVGENYFLEIAKLRAFKVLWINLIKAFLPSNDYIPNPYMHVVLTIHGTETKDTLITQTTRAMSAILGGCDTLLIHGDKKHTTHIQNLLRYESYFDTYRNAADGSFFLENMTAQIAEQAWKKFQQMQTGDILTASITLRNA